MHHNLTPNSLGLARPNPLDLRDLASPKETWTYPPCPSDYSGLTLPGIPPLIREPLSLVVIHVNSKLNDELRIRICTQLQITLFIN